MTWYASKEIEESFREVKDILTPFDLVTWSKLAFIVLLTGSGFMPGFGNTSSMPSDNGYHGSSFSTDSEVYHESTLTRHSFTALPEKLIKGVHSGAEPMPEPELTEFEHSDDFSEASNIYFIAIAAILALVVIPLMIVSSIFEFIFYQSLIDKKVKIRSNFVKHLRNGLSYFAFRLITLVLFLLTFTILILIADISGLLFVLAIITAIPFFLIFLVFMAITHDFVLLEMIDSDQGIIRSWKSFYSVFKNEWNEIFVYLVFKFFISATFSILYFFLAISLIIFMAVPVIIVSGIFSLIFEPLVLIPLLTGFLALFVILLYLKVPFRTYLYYYSILVYRDLTD